MAPDPQVALRTAVLEIVVSKDEAIDSAMLSMAVWTAATFWSMAFSSSFWLERVACSEVSCEIGSEAMETARVIAFWKSLAYELLPVKIGLELVATATEETGAGWRPPRLLMFTASPSEATKRPEERNWPGPSQR